MKQYDAFGMLLSSTGSSASPFGFAGCFGYQEDVDSGLKLLGHRYYDPSTGRFLTRDPAQDGRNWYGYCENEPVGSVDPEGFVIISFGGFAMGAYLAPVGVAGGDVLFDDRGHWGFDAYGGFGPGVGMGGSAGFGFGIAPFSKITPGHGEAWAVDGWVQCHPKTPGAGLSIQVVAAEDGVVLGEGHWGPTFGLGGGFAYLHTYTWDFGKSPDFGHGFFHAMPFMVNAPATPLALVSTHSPTCGGLRRLRNEWNCRRLLAQSGS